eukprot:gene446-532_t
MVGFAQKWRLTLSGGPKTQDVAFEAARKEFKESCDFVISVHDALKKRDKNLLKTFTHPSSMNRCIQKNLKGDHPLAVYNAEIMARVEVVFKEWTLTQKGNYDLVDHFYSRVKIVKDAVAQRDVILSDVELHAEKCRKLRDKGKDPAKAATEEQINKSKHDAYENKNHQVLVDIYQLFEEKQSSFDAPLQSIEQSLMLLFERIHQTLSSSSHHLSRLPPYHNPLNARPPTKPTGVPTGVPLMPVLPQGNGPRPALRPVQAAPQPQAQPQVPGPSQLKPRPMSVQMAAPPVARPLPPSGPQSKPPGARPLPNATQQPPQSIQRPSPQQQQQPPLQPTTMASKPLNSIYQSKVAKPIFTNYERHREMWGKQFKLIQIPAHSVRCDYSFNITAPKLQAKTWYAAMAAPPTPLLRQNIRSAAFDLYDGSEFISTADVILNDNHYLFRAMASVPVLNNTMKTSISGKFVLEVDLFKVSLVEIRPGDSDIPYVEPLAPEEIALYTCDNKKVQLTHPDVHQFIETHSLRPMLYSDGTYENTLCFAYRVSLCIVANLTYSAKLAGVPITETLAAKCGDCGSLAMVFISIMRYNKLPARQIVGRSSSINKPDDGQHHVFAEFYVHNVGWVPYDPAFSVSGGAVEPYTSYFGQDIGELVCFHQDTLTNVDMVLCKSDHHYIQTPLYAASGSGNFDASTTLILQTLTKKKQYPLCFARAQFPITLGSPTIFYAARFKKIMHQGGGGNMNGQGMQGMQGGGMNNNNYSSGGSQNMGGGYYQGGGGGSGSSGGYQSSSNYNSGSSSSSRNNAYSPSNNSGSSSSKSQGYNSGGGSYNGSGGGGGNMNNYGNQGGGMKSSSSGGSSSSNYNNNSNSRMSTQQTSPMNNYGGPNVPIVSGGMPVNIPNMGVNNMPLGNNMPMGNMAVPVVMNGMGGNNMPLGNTWKMRNKDGNYNNKSYKPYNKDRDYRDQSSASYNKDFNTSKVYGKHEGYKKSSSSNSSNSNEGGSSSSSSSSDKKYATRIPDHSFTQIDYDFIHLKKLFPKLHISPDFTRLVASWVDVTSETRMNLHQPTPFVIDSKELNMPQVRVEDTTIPANGHHLQDNIKFNAKVMLFQQIPSSISSQNLNKRLKFLVTKNEKDISCLGGTWDPKIDGDDVNDPQTLIRTAIRATKDYTQFDLEKVTKWIKFMEVHYYRPPTETVAQYQEVTVVFVPDLSEIAPFDGKEHVSKFGTNDEPEKPIDPDEDGEKQSNGAQADADSDQKKESDSPTDTTERRVPHQNGEGDFNSCFSITTPRSESPKYRCMILSLDGLLDYEESDKFEGTFEVSLFGELFYLMLARDMGSLVLESIIDYRPVDAIILEESNNVGNGNTSATTIKRKRDDSMDATGNNEGQSPASSDKRPKSSPDGETPSDIIGDADDQQSIHSGGGGRNHEDAIKAKRYNEAYEFYDQNCVSYLKNEDVELIIHNLGLYLSKSYVQKLVQKVSTEYTSSKGRVFYREINNKQALKK